LSVCVCVCVPASWLCVCPHGFVWRVECLCVFVCSCVFSGVFCGFGLCVFSCVRFLCFNGIPFLTTVIKTRRSLAAPCKIYEQPDFMQSKMNRSKMAARSLLPAGADGTAEAAPAWAIERPNDLYPSHAWYLSAEAFSCARTAYWMGSSKCRPASACSRRAPGR
jgi:hypothetical protein